MWETDPTVTETENCQLSQRRGSFWDIIGAEAFSPEELKILEELLRYVREE